MGSQFRWDLTAKKMKSWIFCEYIWRRIIEHAKPFKPPSGFSGSIRTTWKGKNMYCFSHWSVLVMIQYSLGDGGRKKSVISIFQQCKPWLKVCLGGIGFCATWVSTKKWKSTYWLNSDLVYSRINKSLVLRVFKKKNRFFISVAKLPLWHNTEVKVRPYCLPDIKIRPIPESQAWEPHLRQSPIYCCYTPAHCPSPGRPLLEQIWDPWGLHEIEMHKKLYFQQLSILLHHHHPKLLPSGPSSPLPCHRISLHHPALQQFPRMVSFSRRGKVSALDVLFWSFLPCQSPVQFEASRPL